MVVINCLVFGYLDELVVRLLVAYFQQPVASL